MKRTLIRHAHIVNEGQQFVGSVVIEGEVIAEILTADQEPSVPCQDVIEAKGYYLIPGAIDEHVHFRDPGLTHKADFESASRAAAAGGVTSIMDMPNTNPQTITLEALEEKFDLIAEKSVVNYFCYVGATNQNYKLFDQLNPHRVCGIKLFMGSSTGNMLVDRQSSLLNIFKSTDLLIATHCEEQSIIKANTENYKAIYGDQVTLHYHPDIRSAEACLRSSELAVKLATEANARLHILHLSTADELALFDSSKPLSEKKITAEVCVPHLIFSSDDYARYGAKIKCNPAIKERSHQEALLQALNDGRIDAIATDHAPHLLSEKEGGALQAVSGMPMIQFSLVSMLQLVTRGIVSIETIVQKMCHAPALIYAIRNRGFIRKGYQADLVLLHPDHPWTVSKGNIQSKCQWSPLEGTTFNWKVDQTFINGRPLYSDETINNHGHGQELIFR